MWARRLLHRTSQASWRRPGAGLGWQPRAERAPRAWPVCAVDKCGFCDAPTTFYSSQSGVSVDLPVGLHIHELGLIGPGAGRVPHDELISACLDSNAVFSVELSAEQPDLVALASHKGALQCREADTVSLATLGAPMVAAYAHVGKVDGVDPEQSVEAALRVILAAAEQGLESRVLLQGCIGSTGGHTPDPYDVQAWAAELCDVGCDAIILGAEPGADEDDLQDVLGACKEADVVGVPMQWRLGLRLDPETPAETMQALVDVAVEEVGSIRLFLTAADKLIDFFAGRAAV